MRRLLSRGVKNNGSDAKSDDIVNTTVVVDDDDAVDPKGLYSLVRLASNRKLENVSWFVPRGHVPFLEFFF